MPRPRIDRFWIEGIKQSLAKDRQMGYKTVRAELQHLAREAEKKDGQKEEKLKVPNLSTVQRYVKEFRDLPEEELRQYRLFSWPESMGTPDLPWEASRAALELLAAPPDGQRPTIRLVKWYWRLSLACPEWEPGQRLHFAEWLAAGETSPQKEEAMSKQEANIVKLLQNPDATSIGSGMLLSKEGLEDLLSGFGMTLEQLIQKLQKEDQDNG